MGFEESALTRLKRYREEADRATGLEREAEAAARRLSERLFGGLEYAAALARQAGFGVEAAGSGQIFVLRAVAGPGSEAEVTFGLLNGAAAETDEELMHEDLSRHNLDPSGYSGRVLGWSGEVGGEPCQIFAVYRDGVWKTKGIFVARARGRVDDPDEVLNGFCLRIFGRLVDLAATTGGVGRKWAAGPYALRDLLEGRDHPTEIRLPR